MYLSGRRPCFTFLWHDCCANLSRKRIWISVCSVTFFTLLEFPYGRNNKTHSQWYFWRFLLLFEIYIRLEKTRQIMASVILKNSVRTFFIWRVFSTCLQMWNYSEILKNYYCTVHCNWFNHISYRNQFKSWIYKSMKKIHITYLRMYTLRTVSKWFIQFLWSFAFFKNY